MPHTGNDHLDATGCRKNSLEFSAYAEYVSATPAEATPACFIIIASLHYRQIAADAAFEPEI